MDSKTDMQSSHSAPLAASSDSKASVEGMLRTNTSPTGRNTITGSLSVVSTGPVSTAITATSPTALLHQAFLGTTASDLQDSVDVDIDNIVPLKKQGKLNSMSVNARDNGGFNESMELSEQIAQDMANQVNHIPAEPSADAVASVNFHYYLPLHNLASSYLSAEAMEMVDKAFVIADKAHAPQKRASGEPYIIHPIAVATIIAQMHLDKESIAAALLHDTVEDTCVTPEDIKREFGDVVEDLVNGVTKLDKLRFHDYRA